MNNSVRNQRVSKAKYLCTLIPTSALPSQAFQSNCSKKASD